MHFILGLIADARNYIIKVIGVIRQSMWELYRRGLFRANLHLMS